jgi:hypothetical protein
MLALYRSRRQAEALEVYRHLRRRLVEELGIDPSPAVQALERAILTQDPSLEVLGSVDDASRPERSIFVVGSADDRLNGLLSIAEPLAAQSGQVLILGRAVEHERDLAPAAEATNAHRSKLGVPARAAVFTTTERAADVIRLAQSYEVGLVLLDAPDGLGESQLPDELAEILERSPADVAILAGSEVNLHSATEVCVPFGGSDHDWAALELAAWLAASAGVPIRLLGTRGRPGAGGRDASRLLADASIAVQRLVDVDTEPMLAEPTQDALASALGRPSVVAVGISPRWRHEGIGASRRALMGSRAPLLLVHHGLRPGGLAPRASRSRFTWSLQT